MAEIDADSDGDAQDVAEMFDEDMTDGDDAGSDSDALDLRPDVYDSTAALGDEDLTGADDAFDADEASDELLRGLDSEGEEADTPDEDGDDLVDHDDLASEPLAVDDLPFTTDDRDAADLDDVDRINAAPANEPPIQVVADLEASRSAPLSDLESDTLSDADLEELGYKDPQ